MTIADPVDRFAQLRTLRKVRSEDLDELWAALPTVRAEEILGSWKGSALDNGHPGCAMLIQNPWYGKIFNSLNDAKPLVMYAEDGSLYSNVELMNGEASLWNIEFRGEVTATMVYDGQPVFDHFKRVDERTLLGIMNGKSVELVNEHGVFLYFFLESDA